MILEKTRPLSIIFQSVPALLGLVILFRLILALLVWNVSGPNGFNGADTSSYVAPAQSMLHGSFASYDGQPEIFRTPGYPVLLLPAVSSDHFATVIFLENLLLSVLSAWLVFVITKEISPASSAGKWALGFFALEFLGVLYSLKALSETLFCAQLLLFAWLFVRFLKRPGFPILIFSALALAWATYTRPVGLYLGPLLMAMLVVFPRGLSARRRILQAIVFPIVLAVALTPWIARNAGVSGYRGFSAAGDYVLYFYTAASVEAKVEHKGLARMQEEFGFGGLPYVKNEAYLQRHPEQRTWSLGQIIQFWHSETRRIFREHPFSFVIVHIRGSVTLLLDPGITELLKTLRVYPERGGLMARTIDQGFVRAGVWLIREYPWTLVALAVLGLQLILYYTLAFAGLRRMPLETAAFLLLLVSYLVLISGGPAATGRYRTPVMPFLCVSAGVAISRWKSRRDARVSASAGG